MKSRIRFFVCLLAVLFYTHNLEAAKEGFGVMKKLVTLRRTNPPEVLITGERLQVVGKGGNHGEVASQIAVQLGSEMVQHEPRFSLDDQKPQTRVEVTVLQNSFESDWEKRAGTRMEQAGKDDKGKMQYRQVPVTLHYQVINHRFGVAYAVQDHKAGKTLFADSLDIRFREEFQDGHNAPTEADRVGLSMQQAVEQIVYKLVPTQEVLQVMVPKGSFESFINFAEAGLWSRYSEAIEARPPSPTPVEEAYRQYALGLSYEALGYGADSTETTLRYLDQAAQHYNQALTLHPREDYFSKAYGGSVLSAFGRSSLNVVRGSAGHAPIDASRRQAPAPLQRVQAAMKKYQTLLSQNEVHSGKSAGGAKSAGVPATAQGINNGDVISMIQGGVPEEIVLNSIESAQECAFDTSPTGLIQLTKAKVGKEILKKIQAKPCGREAR